MNRDEWHAQVKRHADAMESKDAKLVPIGPGKSKYVTAGMEYRQFLQDHPEPPAPARPVGAELVEAARNVLHTQGYGIQAALNRVQHALAAHDAEAGETTVEHKTLCSKISCPEHETENCNDCYGYVASNVTQAIYTTVHPLPEAKQDGKDLV